MYFDVTLSLFNESSYKLILLLWLFNNVVSMATYLLYSTKFSYIVICILMKFLIDTHLGIFYTQNLFLLWISTSVVSITTYF